MRFQTDLVPARLTHRYKRFLADCTLADGTAVVAHCPNPGSMMGLAIPGTKIWLEPNDDPKKKLKYSWRLIDHENGHFTGIDTSLPNKLVKAALCNRKIPKFSAYSQVRAEVSPIPGTRIDFLLTEPGLIDTYVEVKSVTLSRSTGVAEFPDRVTMRGTKHLRELTNIARNGRRATMLYIIQRTDCNEMRLASDIDPDDARAFAEAQRAGVETLCMNTHITTQQTWLNNALAFHLDNT
ncbi:MAG: DNA/RNA nuclease SfsA [Pseudomonadota bacterium]